MKNFPYPVSPESVSTFLSDADMTETVIKDGRTFIQVKESPVKKKPPVKKTWEKAIVWVFDAIKAEVKTEFGQVCVETGEVRAMTQYGSVSTQKAYVTEAEARIGCREAVIKQAKSYENKAATLEAQARKIRAQAEKLLKGTV